MILPCPCVTLGSTATADDDADKSAGAERECDPFCALPFVTSEIRVRHVRTPFPLAQVRIPLSQHGLTQFSPLPSFSPHLNRVYLRSHTNSDCG